MAASSQILIIGGGIGGSGLAQGLLKASIPFRVFKREAALNIRSQGYRVRINDVGQIALKALLPSSLYSRLLQSLPPNALSVIPSAHLDALTGEAQKKAGNPPPGPGLSPHQSGEQLNADRSVLRDVLMQGLEAHVEFGKELQEYEITPSGVIARFSDGTEEEGALLIGADGTRSRVRNQFIPSFPIFDTRTRNIYGKTTLTDRSREPVLVLLFEAMRFPKNEHRESLPGDYIYWALMAQSERFQKTSSENDLLELYSAQEAELAQKMTSDWDTSFYPLFSQQNVAQTSILRILSARPESPYWAPSAHVTLIGDAIHPLSPTAAAGATTALRNAAALAELLSENGISAEIVGEYERRMREYAGETIRKSSWVGKLLFGKWDFEDMEVVKV